MSQTSIEAYLINAIKMYQVREEIKGSFLADKIVCQQIIDIPDHTARIHFDETETIEAIETNRKHLDRWLNGQDRIPLRIVPTILRVMGLFPQIDQSRLDDFGHLSKTAKESLEAVDRYRTAIDDGTITPDEARAIWTEGYEAISALLGMMFYAHHKTQTNEESK